MSSGLGGGGSKYASMRFDHLKDGPYAPVQQQDQDGDDDEGSREKPHLTEEITPPGALSPGRKRRDTVRAERRLFGFWVVELVASVFGLVCIGVIIVVLLYESNRRLDDWNLLVSPNAVISFIANLAKTSCVLVLAEVIGQLGWLHFANGAHRLSDLDVFDDASRGPVGAVRLIVRGRQHVLLASTVAIILVVATLLVEPFAQLVLNFESRLTPANGLVASINTAQNYSAGTLPTQNHGPVYAVSLNAPFQVQSAVVAASYGTTPRFELECPTSNCTFPPFTSVGVCSACEDVTARSETTCSKPLNITRWASGGFPVCHTSVPYQDLPVFSKLKEICEAEETYGCSPPDPIRFNWQMTTDAAGTYGTVFNSTPVKLLPSYVGARLPPGEEAVFAAFSSYKLDGSVSTRAPSQVMQCKFSLCLQSFSNVEVRNGQTSEGSVSSVPLAYAEEPSLQAGLSPFNVRAKVDGQITGANHTIDYSDYFNIAQYFQHVFRTGVYADTGQFLPDGGSKLAPTLGFTMYKSTNLTAMMDLVAKSVSVSMRTAQNNITTINGKALLVETYIHIEWKWLSLPIIIALLSPILLITVAVQSYMRGVEPWKHSTLPLLFYSLEGWDEDMLLFNDLQEMSDKANAMRGRLLQGAGHRVFQREDIAG